MKLSIKTKISSVIALLIMAVAIINAAFFIRHSHRQMEDVLIEKGTALSSSLSKAAEEGMAGENLDLLKRAEYIVNEKGVTLSQIYSTAWNAVDAYPFEKLNESPLPEAIEHFKSSSSLFYKKSGNLYDFYTPILFKPDENSEAILIGYARLILSSSDLEAEMQGRLRTDILTFIAIALLAMIALNMLLSRFVIAPLLRLRKSIAAFQKSGMQEIVPVTSNDEIGDLVSAFNRMSRTISDNTFEIKKASDEVYKERDFLQSTINSLPGIFYLFDRTGKFMCWNRNFEIVTGYSAEEISRMNPLDFFEGSDKALVRERIEEVFVKGFSEVEALLTSKLGRLTPFYFNGHVIQADGKECLIGMGIDITERKRIEDFLIEAEERYRQIFDSAADAIFIFDKKGNFLNVNRIAYERLGYSKEEMLAMNIRELVSPEFAVTVPERLNEIERNGAAIFESAHMRKDGTVMFVEVHSRLFNYMGQEVFFSVIRDITERKKMEEHLRQAQKMESVGQLAGGVAHDFNNILTAIVNHSYILKKRFENDKAVTENVDKILLLSQNAAKITQELLIFSRKQPLETAPLNLNDFIIGTIKLLRNFIPENIEIRTELAEDALMIMADRNQLDQVIMNLSSNSADAMPEGGVLTIKTDRIHMDYNFISLHGYGREGIYALLSFTDTGVGMDKDTVRKVFELFFTTKEAGKGTGLGLSIVYGIVKKHGGYINVYSEPGIGTTFNIYLPETKTEAEASEEIICPYLNGKRETILYAEDEPGVRESMMKIIEHFNYRIIAAVDGKDAVEKFLEHKDEIDLLVFDVVMPKMGGQKAFQEIRAVMPEMKVIFTSGYANDEISTQEIHKEGVFFMMKPLYPEKFLSKIREALDS